MDGGSTNVLESGDRIGRYVVLRGIDGQVNAVAPTSVAALCATEDGTLLMLPGGRLIQMAESLVTVLGWLDVGALSRRRSSTMPPHDLPVTQAGHHA